MNYEETDTGNGIGSDNGGAPEESAKYLSFSQALDGLKLGSMASRVGWNGTGQFLQLQVPDAHSKMTLPYIFITTVQGDRVPWVASQTDILANDWVFVLY